MKNIWNNLWTKKDVAKLIKLWNSGLSSPEIAEYFPERTRNGVKTKLQRLAVDDDQRFKRPYGRYGDFTDKMLLDLMDMRERKKLSFATIGERLGHTENACAVRYEAILRDLKKFEAAGKI